MENYNIRMGAEPDLGAILQIEEDCYPLPWSLQQFVQELENPVASLLVCEVENKIVGYICYWLIADEMQILNLATALPFRRKGVAAQLMTRAFSCCLPELLSSVWLEVRVANRAAIALYQRYGFKQNGIRKAYYRDGEDAIVMMKILKNQ